MITITQLQTDKAILEIDLSMTPQTRLFFKTLLQAIDEQTVITGSGSPETFIEAGVNKQYMDTAGTAGNILYIKRDADIAGDKTKGWILV